MNKDEKATAAALAGYREKYAMKHGKPKKIQTNGRTLYKYTYSPADSYQDANGATYDATNKKWVN